MGVKRVVANFYFFSIMAPIMSENELTLAFTPREVLGKTSKRLPAESMAAVFYGHKEASTPIVVAKADFKKVFKKAGESTVVTLTHDGKKIEALIREVDVDPIKGELRHADFYVLEKGKKVQIDVPLEFTGDAPAVKLGGIVVKVLHEIKVEADPKHLPHEITVDIGALTALDSHITVKELKLPSGVVAIEGADEIVASITVAKEEVEAAPIDLSAIEVEKKGKKEEASSGEVEEA